MLQRRIASRYAKALFDLAQQEGKTEAWEGELATLASLMAATPELTSVLTHPEIPLRRKEAVLNRAFAGKVAQEILTVLLMLIRRGHEPDVDLIHGIFRELWNEARRVIPVSVTSAVPLTEAQTSALTQTLARRTQATIQLSRTVAPDLIAGMVVIIGDRVVDASARATLEELRTAMRGM